MNKKIIIWSAIFCLCFQAMTVLAATPDFSGFWQIDVNKSVLPDTMPVESLTMKVTQTEKEIKIESTRKSSQNSDDGTRRSVSVIKQIVAFNLEDNMTTTTTDVGSGATQGSEVRQAKITADGKFSLTTTRRFTDQSRAAEKTNEIWELLDEGKTLKITRYVESATGAVNAEMYFTRKSSGNTSDAAMVEDVDVFQSPAVSGTNKMPKVISGGVLNGKATNLVKPEYPAAARVVRASGAVNVQVTIDENGNVISASAVSGHPLLRQAAEQAARSSQFAPTTLSGVLVKVTGIIVYNFVP